MTANTDTTKDLSNQDATIYWLAIIMPLTMILVCFISGGWNWGLMDDTSMVRIPGNVWQRFVDMFYGFLGDGRFNPISYLHAAIFYKIFVSQPVGFYIFRWFEVVFTLGIWGLFAHRLTGEKTAVPLFFTIALSFYKTYDGFFYLSIQEIIGVLFTGLACFFLFTGVKKTLDQKTRIDRTKIFFGTLFLLAAYGSKETFVATGIAIGITFIILSFKKPDRKMIMGMGVIILALTFLYGIFLKFFISKGYSSAYSLTNTSEIKWNIFLWTHKPLLFHLPWILLTVILMAGLKTKGKPIRDIQRCGVYLGAALYVFYGVLLLPWSTWGHYAFPLGIFFAFLITVLIAERMQRLTKGFRNMILIVAMFYCAFVSWAALRDQLTYQRDSASLIEWIAENSIFEHDLQEGAVVRGNACEPCDTIPIKVGMLYHKKYSSFVFTTAVRDILADPQTRYYLWGRYWGDQDLRLLGHDLWTPVFVSEHWVMFRRMY